jgi:hypothetical protein
VMSKYGLGRRRSADVAHADKQHPDCLVDSHTGQYALSRDDAFPRAPPLTSYAWT